MRSNYALLLALGLSLHHVSAGRQEVLEFEDNFDELDFDKWQPEVTMWGGGNNEFEMYVNNRTTSFVRDGVLYLKPVPTADWLGEDAVKNGYQLSLWGGQPGDYCTNADNWGCVRTSGD